MTEPEKDTVKPEDATSTPRAEEESTQVLSKTLYAEKVQSDIRDIRNRLIKIEADNRRRDRLRLREVFRASILIVAPLSALFSAPFSLLFSWVFSPDGATIDIKPLDSLGILAIVLAIIGVVVFFYITFLTMRRSDETSEMLDEVDKQSSDRQRFDEFVASSLEEQHKQRKDIQEIKDLIDRGKRSE